VAAGVSEAGLPPVALERRARAAGLAALLRRVQPVAAAPEAVPGAAARILETLHVAGTLRVLSGLTSDRARRRRQLLVLSAEIIVQRQVCGAGVVRPFLGTFAGGVGEATLVAGAFVGTSRGAGNDTVIVRIVEVHSAIIAVGIFAARPREAGLSTITLKSVT